MSLSDLKQTGNPTISVKKILPFFNFIVLRRYQIDFKVFWCSESPGRVLSNFATFLR